MEQSRQVMVVFTGSHEPKLDSAYPNPDSNRAEPLEQPEGKLCWHAAKEKPKKRGGYNLFVTPAVAKELEHMLHHKNRLSE
jgi:hypothetical protein